MNKQFDILISISSETKTGDGNSKMYLEMVRKHMQLKVRGVLDVLSQFFIMLIVNSELSK